MEFHPTWEQRHRKLANFMRMIQCIIVVLLAPIMCRNLRLFIAFIGLLVIIYESIEIYENFIEANLGNKLLLIVYSLIFTALAILSITFSFFEPYSMPVTICSLTVGFLAFKAYRIAAIGLFDKDLNLYISILLIVMGFIGTTILFLGNKMFFYTVFFSICVFYWIYYWIVRLIMEKRDIKKDDIE